MRIELLELIHKTLELSDGGPLFHELNWRNEPLYTYNVVTSSSFGISSIKLVEYTLKYPDGKPHIKVDNRWDSSSIKVEIGRSKRLFGLLKDKVIYEAHYTDITKHFITMGSLKYELTPEEFNELWIATEAAWNKTQELKLSYREKEMESKIRRRLKDLKK